MIIDDTYLHSLDPIALDLHSIGIPLAVRWYGLSYLLGFYLTYLLIRWFIKKGVSPLTPTLASDFIFTAALGTVIGGRLGYCIFYSPDLLLSFESTPPFWGVLAIHKGGMASHGGMIGITVACIYFARKNSLSIAHLCDLTSIGGTLGVFFGRIANFVNGELVGRPVQSAVSWAVKFPQDILGWSYHKLETLSPVVSTLGIEPPQWNELLQRASFNQSANRQVEDMLLMIITRIQQDDTQLGQLLAPLLEARHPSQLYESALEGLLLFLILLFAFRTPKKPGVITGIFLTCYAIVRIIGEQFRMPDPQIGFQLWGLTRGQILSGIMLIIAIVVLIYNCRKNMPSYRGWGRTKTL